MAPAGTAALELGPSHFLVAEGEAEVWSSVFRTLSQRGQVTSFTHHHTSATTDPRNLAAELAEALQLSRSNRLFRVDPVLPICVICSRQPDQIIAESLNLLAEKLAERLRFRVDWFAVAGGDAEVDGWIGLLRQLERSGALNACSVYLLSRQIGSDRLGDPESKLVLARLISLFALTAPSRWENELSFSRFRFKDGFHAWIVGLEVFSVGDVAQAAKELIDREIWRRMWPELSEDVRERARAWVSKHQPDTLTPLLRLVANSVPLAELADGLESVPAKPDEHERHRKLALEIRRAVANEENDRKRPMVRKGGRLLPVERMFDVKGACASSVTSGAERVFDECPLPILLYVGAPWPEMAPTRARLQAAHTGAATGIVPGICRKFRGWAQAVQHEWLRPNESERARLVAVTKHLRCSSKVSRAELFTFAAPELAADLRDELANLAGCVSYLYALEVGCPGGCMTNGSILDLR
jgi:hypothetical protein